MNMFNTVLFASTAVIMLWLMTMAESNSGATMVLLVVAILSTMVSVMSYLAHREARKH